MNAYCPECETELEPNSGVCPACRWDSGFSKGSGVVRTSRTTEGSISDRYRGTAYDSTVQFTQVVDPDAGVSRGRTFVIVGLVVGVVLYGLVLSSMVQF
jgi:hypothetical protein